MKKMRSILLVIALFFSFTSCQSSSEFEAYDEQTFGYIDIQKDRVTILQLTDLHFTYGFDYLDRKTYRLMDALVQQAAPDIIVVTGDIFMSLIGRIVFRQFIYHMETYHIPWTFIFGNHEGDFHSMTSLLDVVYRIDTTYLYFHPGPVLSGDNSHGYGNFKLKIMNHDKPILNLYLLDSKANRKDGIVDKRFPYDYVSEEQVAWYQQEVENDVVESLLFVHIPLMEYLEYEGSENQEKIWPQGKNTGLFQAMLDAGTKTRGVFVGHDHLNNFDFLLDGVLLAYGQASGYNGYGILPKGARVIEYRLENKELQTYLLLDHEVVS